ncbi:hypothetical protein NIZ92_06685 [Alcaligenes sp. 1735tsa3]|uniref:hypothetical protein n=1 Tax=Alcaligenes sp. 1735tsa3 TaxID=2953809 RepID=UPI0020A78C08|nr:hypothetical protein [Alcaligenes sp. 1735tsa3]USY26718.1 hypothetical protein NIZ92_06685 [Alcaligenes sp. 1735tsa3]
MSAEQLKDILARRGKDPEINLLLREISYMRCILRETDEFLVLIEGTSWHNERKERKYENLAIAVRQHKAVKEWRKQQRTVEQLRAADN